MMSQNNKDVIRPKAISGVIDLSNYDFEKSGVTPIKGEWLHIENQFVSIQERFPNEDATIYRLPRQMAIIEDDDIPLEGTGFGSYHVKIILPRKRQKNIALKIPEIGTAYSAYINGAKITQLGEIAKYKKNSVPKVKPVIIPVYDDEREWDLLIHYSNFHFIWEGLWDPIKIGYFEDFVNERGKSIREIFFYCGIFLMMSLFHFIFFLLRNKDSLSISFTCITLIILTRLLFVDDLFIFNLIPNLSFSIIKKVRYGSFYLLIPAFMLFLKNAFPGEINKTLSLIFFIIGVVSTVFVIVTPPIVFIETLIPYDLFTFIFIIYALFVITLALVKKREGANVLLVGTIIFSFFAVNTILYNQRIIQTLFPLNLGLILSVISQSILVNLRFATSYNLNIKLGKELNEKNQNLKALTQDLEERVDKRKDELRKAYKEIKSLALTDELTGLSNRRSITELLYFEEDKAIRKKHVFSIALMDIDNFKSVNDTYGHDIGDKVLKVVSEVASSVLRQQDKVARWGGEEFLLLFPEIGIKEAFNVADRVRNEVEKRSIPVLDNMLSVTVTIGLCSYHEDLGIKGVIKEADEGLYIGKKKGKNQVVKMNA